MSERKTIRFEEREVAVINDIARRYSLDFGSAVRLIINDWRECVGDNHFFFAEEIEAATKYSKAEQK